MKLLPFIKYVIFSALGVLATLLFFSGTPRADAASLYIGPTAGSFNIGNTFTVSIFLNTGGHAVNAIAADLSFPADKLQVVSPSTGKSLIQIWTAQPSYSNQDGYVKFRGAVPNPGITTEGGLISTITFRVKNIGTVALRFLDSSRVLLNDGKGTEVLSNTTGAIYYLTLPPPEGPIVVSRTNPDQDKWYQTKTVVFEWTAPPDIQGYSYVLDDHPDTTPDNISEGTNTRAAYENVADGEHYFHIKALRQGAWGGTTDYAIKVDNSAPAAFDIDISPAANTSDRVPIITFQTTDAESGVDHYEISVTPLAGGGNDKNSEPFFIETTSPYINTFEIGRYLSIVRAYDRAGNYYETQKQLAIVNPVFEIIRDKGVRLGGAYTLAWPYAGILAMAILAALTYSGRLAWRWHRKMERYFEAGVAAYPSVDALMSELKEKQKDYGGGSAGSGEKLTAAVLVGATGAQYFYLVLTIIFLLGFLGLVVFTVYHVYHAEKKSRRLREKIREAEEALRRGFVLLRRDIEEELALVHRIRLNRKLTAEEKAREEKLVKDLVVVSRHVGKEIWEIEKNV